MSDSFLLAQGLWQRIAENDFYRYALAGGVAAAVFCGLLSVFVVLRRMAFIGQGISHAAFGGVGVALLAGLAADSLRGPLARDAVIAVFCVATAVGIGWLARRGRMSEDVAIGICLAAAMAVGVFLLDLRAHWLDLLARSGRSDAQLGYTPSFHNILFGNIYFISPQEVALSWVLAVLVVGATVLLFKELVFFAFDEETAAVFGVRTGLLYYGLLVALGLAIVMGMRTVGVVMVSALLVLPGAAARMWSARIGRVAVLSVVLAVAGVVAGLLLAIELRFPSPGAVIVLTLTAVFLASWLVGRLHRHRRRSPRAPGRTDRPSEGDQA